MQVWDILTRLGNGLVEMFMIKFALIPKEIYRVDSLSPRPDADNNTTVRLFSWRRDRSIHLNRDWQRTDSMRSDSRTFPPPSGSFTSVYDRVRRRTPRLAGDIR